MQEAWARISARGPGWYLVANQLRVGDTYHACSLLKAFKEAHGSKLPIYLLAAGAAHTQVAQLFAEYITETIMEPGLPQEREAWEAFFRETGLPAFGPGTPILLHPMTNASTCRLDRFSVENELNWMQLYKHILYLPGDAAPVAPVVRREVVEEAGRYCEAQGVERLNSVLLFPYAQSLRADGFEHFAALAAELGARGRKVFTSLSVDEDVIPGTTPIFIPFPILREVAEWAGWVVAVRSGICDMTSSAKCRKTFIYRNARERTLWSVNRMNLARDAVEEAFSFVWQTPQAFRDLVCRPKPPPFPKARRPLSSLIGQGPMGRKVRSVSFRDLETGMDALHTAATAAGEQGATGSVLRIADIPSRQDARWTPVVEDLLARLFPVLEPSGKQWFACRDDGGDFDFFEEIDMPAVVAGHYANGRTWHSLLSVSDGSLSDLLPEAAREHILPLEPLRTRRTIPVVGGSDPGKLAAYLSGCRPYSSSGVQLLDGWYEPEPWGAWSRDRRCSFKLTLEDPPKSGFTLVLGCHAAISSTFSALPYAAQVNGLPAGRGAITLRSNGQPLKIPVPASAARGRTVLVELHFDEVRSPSDQGAGPDGRLLGIAFKWIQAQPPGFRERLRRAAADTSRVSLAGTPMLESERAPHRSGPTAAGS